MLFFRPFFQIFGPQRGQISRKGWVRYKHWRGVIDKPILGLLTFGSNLETLYKMPKTQFSYICHDFFGRFSIYLAASAAKYCEKGLAATGKSFEKGLGRFWKKLSFQAVIKSAASAASREINNQGPRSRGAHGRRLGMRTTGFGWAFLDLGP